MTILESELSNLFTRKTTTLNFEGNTIRCLTLKGDQIQSWDKLTFSSEQMSQGLVHQPPIVSKQLDRLLDKTDADRRNVFTSVTDHRSVHRILILPAIDEKLLDETIQRKAKQEFALPLDEVDISWKIVNRSENKLRLYVLAVPKQIIDRQMSTLQNSKIKPRMMDAKPLALMQAVNRRQALIINLENYSMAVIIIVAGVPVIVRTVPLESGELTREAKLDLLHQELARTTKFYNESNKQNRLPEDTPLFPTGALFDTQPVEERLEETISLITRLQERTPYPIKSLHPPLSFPSQLPLGEYAVNLGLAVKARR
ncbi:MAG: pilus assembly protein PilM [Anaerolineales bacterium]|nr:pilus assembly protein PilM [Anaerolineales bacterium]MDZ7844602.1 pilus assembly protein PilM [Anaerolineales bacterium]